MALIKHTIDGLDAGLINQLYSHISAISLGVVLGAEIVLPPAAVRDSFAHYFSVFKDRNEVVWTAAPVDTLIDAGALIDFWGQRGVEIVKVRRWPRRALAVLAVGFRIVWVTQCWG